MASLVQVLLAGLLVGVALATPQVFPTASAKPPFPAQAVGFDDPEYEDANPSSSQQERERKTSTSTPRSGFVNPRDKASTSSSHFGSSDPDDMAPGAPSRFDSPNPIHRTPAPPFGRNTDHGQRDRSSLFGSNTDSSQDRSSFGRNTDSRQEDRSSLFGSNTDSSQDRSSPFSRSTDSKQEDRSSSFGRNKDTDNGRQRKGWSRNAPFAPSSSSFVTQNKSLFICLISFVLFQMTSY